MKTIISALRNGIFVFEDAIALSGFSHVQVYEWLRRGGEDIEEGNDTEYSRFVNDCARADAQCVEELTSITMTQARDGNMQAIKLIMDRKRPAKQNVVVSGDPDAPVPILSISAAEWNGEACDEDGDPIPVGKCTPVKVDDGEKDAQ